MKEKYYCPVNAWDCPYYRSNGTCDCENPLEECDDAMTYEEGFSEDDTVTIFYSKEEPPQPRLSAARARRHFAQKVLRKLFYFCVF